MAQVFFIPPRGPCSGRLSLGQAQLHPHVLPDVAQCRPRAAHAKRLAGLAGLTGHHRHQQPAAGEEAAERGEKGDGDGPWEESARSSKENGGHCDILMEIEWIWWNWGRSTPVKTYEQMTFGTKFRPCLWDCLCQLREWWINPRKKHGLGEGGYFTHMCAWLERPEKHICGY